MAWNLQHAPERFVIQAFRGVGKSWILVAFCLWHLFLDPQKKIMVVSASQGLADDFSRFSKQLIYGMPLLQHLKPNIGQRDSGIAFDVGPAMPSKDPSLKSVGITGQLTGSRADIIVADDIEIPKNSYTHLLRTRLAELVKEFDAVLKPGGRVIYLGTPQVEDTLYSKLPERGYTIRVWTAEIPVKAELYHGRLADFVTKRIAAGWAPGTPVDPDRFDDEELFKRKLSYGKSGFALQFMLDPTPSDADAHPLKCRDLIISSLDPEMGPTKLVWGSDRAQVVQDLMCGGYDGDFYVSPMWRADQMEKWQGTVMAIDPSGRGKDETGYAIVRYLYGKLYLVASGGFKDGFAVETLTALAKAAKLHGVNYVIVEDNYGGGMFSQLLKPYLAAEHTGGIDEEWDAWSKGQKELRIMDTLEPLISTHKLVVSRDVIEADLRVQEETPYYSLIFQMTRMGREKGLLAHEDRLEALSMACAYHMDRMARDENKAYDDHKAKLLDAELRKFMANALGRPAAPETFHQTAMRR
ncbi:terminase large subunit [Caudoviricetes sp.]|nr:terminase large subunit [Caudoviricetes sp.]